MKWFALAQLVRLPNVFTAMADIGLAAMAVTIVRYPDPAPTFAAFVMLLASSSMLYMAGMVFNDYFDVAQDKRERPGRPIASGRIAPRDAAATGAALIFGGLLSAGLADVARGGGWASITIASILTGVIFGYDAFFKRNWLGPYAMGACRSLNVLLGLSIAGSTIAPWGYALALAIGVYICGVTWFAKTEARMSKQPSLLTAALIMAGGVFLGLTVPALALEDAASAPTPSPVFPYLLALFAVYLGMKIVPAVRDPRPDRVQPAVKRSVLGLVFFDAILATALVGWPGLFLMVLLVPAKWLGQWLYST